MSRNRIEIMKVVDEHGPLGMSSKTRSCRLSSWLEEQLQEPATDEMQDKLAGPGWERKEETTRPRRRQGEEK